MFPNPEIRLGSFNIPAVGWSRRQWNTKPSNNYYFRYKHEQSGEHQLKKMLNFKFKNIGGRNRFKNYYGKYKNNDSNKPHQYQQQMLRKSSAEDASSHFNCNSEHEELMTVNSKVSTQNESKQYYLEGNYFPINFKNTIENSKEMTSHGMWKQNSVVIHKNPSIVQKSYEKDETSSSESEFDYECGLDLNHIHYDDSIITQTCCSTIKEVPVNTAPLLSCGMQEQEFQERKICNGTVFKTSKLTKLNQVKSMVFDLCSKINYAKDMLGELFANGYHQVDNVITRILRVRRGSNNLQPKSIGGSSYIFNSTWTKDRDSSDDTSSASKSHKENHVFNESCEQTTVSTSLGLNNRISSNGGNVNNWNSCWINVEIPHSSKPPTTHSYAGRTDIGHDTDSNLKGRMLHRSSDSNKRKSSDSKYLFQSTKVKRVKNS